MMSMELGHTHDLALNPFRSLSSFSLFDLTLSSIARLRTHISTTSVHPSNMAQPAIFRWVFPTAIAAGLIQSSIYDVKGGSRAVIFDRLAGVKENVVNEGTHFLIPWLQKSIIFDVRTRPRNISTTTGSKDLQMVTLTLRVLHRPEVKMLPKIYQVRHTLRTSSYSPCVFEMIYKLVMLYELQD